MESGVADVEEIRPEDFQGRNKTWLVTFDGTGERAYFKPAGGVRIAVASMFGLDREEVVLCEAAAWRVAHALGSPWLDLIPPCVVRWIDAVDPNAPGSLSAERFGDREMSLFGLLHAPRSCLQGAFIDALIGNMDRSLTNFRYEPSHGEMAMLDHGFAFPNQNGIINECELLEWRHRLELAALTNEEIAALETVIESPDCCGVSRYLGDERAHAMVGRARKMRDTGRLLLRTELLP